MQAVGPGFACLRSLSFPFAGSVARQVSSYRLPTARPRPSTFRIENIKYTTSTCTAYCCAEILSQLQM